MSDFAEQFLGFHSAFTAQRAFPDREHTPTRGIQRYQIVSILLPVLREFCPPEGRIRLRPLKKLAIVLVPEAAVDENNSTIFGQHEIRASWQGALVESVSKPQPKQAFADRMLRFCVFAANSGHAVAALRR